MFFAYKWGNNWKEVFIWKKKQLYTTSDVMKILKIGNRACLDLFHRSDFPCVKVGRAFKISEENFREYFSTRRVND